jgi:hypothetical protein
VFDAEFDMNLQLIWAGSSVSPVASSTRCDTSTPISQSTSTSRRTQTLACTRSRSGTWNDSWIHGLKKEGQEDSIICKDRGLTLPTVTSSARRSCVRSSCTQVLTSSHPRIKRTNCSSPASPSRTFPRAQQTSNKLAR